MDQEKFLLKDHIMELDAVIRPAAVSTFLRYLNYKDSQGDFDSAKIIGPDKEEEKTNIRKCTHYDFTNITPSITDQHWANMCYHIFTQACNTYKAHHPMLTINKVYDIQALKYSPGGHYITHVDDHPDVPRSLSFIWRLNNDYEGGDLTWSMHGKEFMRSKTKPNSMIIWPSSFLYPHCVEPITKGTRWSIVAWAR